MMIESVDKLLWAKDGSKQPSATAATTDNVTSRKVTQPNTEGTVSSSNVYSNGEGKRAVATANSSQSPSLRIKSANFTSSS